MWTTLWTDDMNEEESQEQEVDAAVSKTFDCLPLGWSFTKWFFIGPPPVMSPLECDVDRSSWMWQLLECSDEPIHASICAVGSVTETHF